MIVHSLDGILEPIRPEKLRYVMQELMSEVKQQHGIQQGDYILGLDSGGIVPGVTASLITKLPLYIAYKAELEIENKLNFYEPGSANPNVFVYNLPIQGRAIIIDDEIRTGRTIENCIMSFEMLEKDINSIVVPVESTKFNARKKVEELGYNLFSYGLHDF
ncbi:hypothetical protein HN385_02500 [archaeon]|nr:hypothetical protein [archaeon]MBT6868799.1 hypothetical protein [archaeon]